MWGNLGLASEERREVPVPLLLPGQVGVVSVAFVAPVMEGMYTSHWRLAHCGCQFGPRVWCSIVVDSSSSRNGLGHQSKRLASLLPIDITYSICLHRHDLLSFELLDINIVQELEKVPNNTPVGVKLRPKDVSEPVAQEEEKEEEISGAQFLCETVIRSLTLEEAPDHRPLRRAKHSSLKPQDPELGAQNENLNISSHQDNEDKEVLHAMQNMKEKNCEKEEGRTRDDWDEVSSQTSSVSSSDDYIIVLPDCFDTSRPLGESMYSSAMSQPDTAACTAASSTDPDQEQEKDEPCNFEPCREVPLMERKEEETIAVEESLGNTWPLHVSPIHSSVNQMLCASQTLDAVTLTPEVVPPPVVPQPLHPTPVIYSPSCSYRFEVMLLTSLWIDPAARQDPSMMAVLLEMGFKDQRLNQQLLRKHGYNLLHTVNELVQMAEESQNEAADAPQ
ncbi:hypothetical protein GOODEAATRI_011554 [Goodea atripinnis]|uniref:Uncharacterized protein n=1 Tax=Goodea atripinnis TaxID=208336 RepID=A0ABV0P3J3_9TELE